MRKSLDLNQVAIFKQVVAAGSFTKAAALLGIPKSRVSRTIMALEREVGVPLIYRTTRSFQLTDAGTAFYRKTAGALDELNDALHELSSYAEEVSGLLRISAPEDMGVSLLTQVCHEFMISYPRVTIELRLENRFVDLVQESVDVALRVGKLRDSSMQRRLVGRVRMIFVMTPELYERHQINKLADLERLPFLAFSPTKISRDGMVFHKGKERRQVKPLIHFSSNNYFALRSMALQGGAWALLPAFLVTEELRRGHLVQLFKDWQYDQYPVQFVMPPQKEQSPRVERFVAFARKKIASAFS